VGLVVRRLLLLFLLLSPVLAGAQTGSAPNPTYNNLTVNNTLNGRIGNFSGKITTAGPTTAQANFNLPQGTAPVSPINGDMWMTATGLYFRVAGVTVGPVGTGGGGGSNLTFVDGAGTSFPSAVNVTLAGTAGSGSAGVFVFTPTSTIRKPVINTTVLAADMGNVIVQNGSSLTLTIPAISSTIFASGEQLLYCNANATAVSGSSTPAIIGYPNTGGGPFTFTVPGLTQSVMTCIGMSSDGTSLYFSTMGYPANAIYNATAGQAFTGGIHPTAYANGTFSSGTATIDCGNGPIQTLTNNGAFTLAMSANDGSCILRITNGTSAGAVTFSGFIQGSNSGDSLTTTNTSKFDLSLTRIGASPHYLISALQ